MNESRTLTVDHLCAWVRHCEEQGDETVVGETMSSTHCLGASALKHIYQTQEVFVGSSNTRTWVGDEAIGIDTVATRILDEFDRVWGVIEDDLYDMAPVTVAMLRETSVWGMLFPEEEEMHG